MKPNLLICLGNPLMGDDGIAWRLFHHIRVQDGLPADWDLHFAGTDLLSSAGAMNDRRCVVLADALESPLPPGTVEIVNADSFAGEAASPAAHQLSAMEALRLIQLTSDGVRGVRFILFGVAVHSVRRGDNLSPPLETRLPQIVRAMLTLAREISQDRPHRLYG